MTRFISLNKSDQPDKKYMVELESSSGRKKVIHFGAKGMNDYTTFNALERDERRRRYLMRHRARENWNDPETAGFWSRWILWGDTPNIQTNLKRVRAKFSI